MIYLLLGATNLTHEDGKLIFQVIMILVTMEMMIMVKKIKMMMMVMLLMNK